MFDARVIKTQAQAQVIINDLTSRIQDLELEKQQIEKQIQGLLPLANRIEADWLSFSSEINALERLILSLQNDPDYGNGGVVDKLVSEINYKLIDLRYRQFQNNQRSLNSGIVRIVKAMNRWEEIAKILPTVEQNRAQVIVFYSAYR
jgi:hypothetical protein